MTRPSTGPYVGPMVTTPIGASAFNDGTKELTTAQKWYDRIFTVINRINNRLATLLGPPDLYYEASYWNGAAIPHGSGGTFDVIYDISSGDPTQNPATPGVFTAPIDGWYAIEWVMEAELFVAQTFYTFIANAANTELKRGDQIVMFSGTTFGGEVGGSAVLQLTAGTTIKIRANGTGNWQQGVGFAIGNTLSIYRVRGA